jgi:hypothetical protein
MDLFHKVLRQLNITNASSLQAFAASRLPEFVINPRWQVAICNLKFTIWIHSWGLSSVGRAPQWHQWPGDILK